MGWLSTVLAEVGILSACSSRIDRMFEVGRFAAHVGGLADLGEIADLDAAAALAVAAQARAAADRAEAVLLAVAAHYADLHPGPGVDRDDAVDETERLPGMERARVYGGEGCPEVAEFAPAELGAVLGISSYAAAELIGDALGLRHRLPLTWARVVAGEVQAWRARRIATACRGLNPAAAGFVDATVAAVAQSLTSYRLARVVRAAVLHADPALARAAADRAAADRGVWVGHDDIDGTRTVLVKASTGDAARFDAAVDLLADCLARLGDTDPKEQRRAKAIGWLANPQAALNLYDEATTHPHPDHDPDTDIGAELDADHDAAHDIVPEGGCDTGVDVDSDPDGDADIAVDVGGRGGGERDRVSEPRAGSDAGSGAGSEPLAARLARLRDTTGYFAPLPQRRRRRRGGGRGTASAGRPVLYVHLSDLTLATGDGVVRVDGDRTLHDLGPMLATQLTELLGHDRFVIKPVIDLHDRISVDAYEIPDRIRERLQLTYPRCYFPWCNLPATRADLDHIDAYDDTGPPDQTSTDTLGPGCRLHHRLKTHGGWTCHRLPDGAFEWTSPHRHRYRVDHTGTHPLDHGTEDGDAA